MFQILYIILTLLTYLIYRHWSNRNLPPGPNNLPILGYLPWLDAEAPHITLTQLSKIYGPIYGLYLGNVYTVILTDHKLVKIAFAKDAISGRAPLYVTHGIMKGYGIICAEGELWKDQRKFVGGCLRQFGRKRDELQALILSEAKGFINYVKEQGNSEFAILNPVEPLRHNIGCVMNILVFGKSYDRDDEVWNWLQLLQEEGTKLIGVAGPLNFLPFLRFIPKYEKTMKFLLDGKHRTHKVYKKIVDDCKEKLDNDQKTDENYMPNNILESFLMEKEKRTGTPEYNKFYNDQQFYHLLADVFGAGLDTTLVTLSWFILFMATNIQVQSRVQEELDSILQDQNPTLDDITNLPLLEAALAETQRIRSVVPMGIPHGCLEETALEGFRIPKHAMVVPLQWAMHMDPKIWNEPEIFNPDRFLDDEGRFKKIEGYIPFQSGKRMCIGDELAKMLLVLFGASILKEFKISTKNNEEIDMNGVTGITLAPKSVDIEFTFRNK